MTVVGTTTSSRLWNSLEVDIITAMATIGIVGVLSNIAVLVVLFKKENRKLATNRYLTSLAISDIFMSCFISLLVLNNIYQFTWSPIKCRFYLIIHYLPLYLGINSIMLIAVERFVAIVLPTRFRAFVVPGMVKLQLTFVWLLTCLELVMPLYVVRVSHVCN
ncbi:hypothetical protein LSAT2_032192 [Lamellibrachia satsuma]|nr:hypothetical protein LSAT2_032192 [Lamellibrachia satsuma]